MFELYTLPQFPVPFPKNLAGYYSSEKQLIKDLRLTAGELDALLDGKVVREKYILEYSPEFINMITHGKRILPEGLLEREIAEILNCSVNSICKAIERVKKKLNSASKDGWKNFLFLILEYREIREKNSGTNYSASVTFSD